MDEKLKLAATALLAVLVLAPVSESWFVAETDKPPSVMPAQVIRLPEYPKQQQQQQQQQQEKRRQQREQQESEKVLEGSKEHSVIVLRSRQSRVPTPSPSPPPLKCRMRLYSMQSRWTFAEETGRCEWFAYNGRNLNSGNVFQSRADCENYCMRGIGNPCDAAQCEQQVEYMSTRCEVQNDTQCMWDMVRKHKLNSTEFGPPPVLDAARRDIERFCTAPIAVCQHYSPISDISQYTTNPRNKFAAEPPVRCTLPRDSGRCPTRKQPPRRRYYYNSAAKVCKYMQYFGCGGNDNRFASIKECYDLCGE